MYQDTLARWNTAIKEARTETPEPTQGDSVDDAWGRIKEAASKMKMLKNVGGELLEGAGSAARKVSDKVGAGFKKAPAAKAAPVAPKAAPAAKAPAAAPKPTPPPLPAAASAVRGSPLRQRYHAALKDIKGLQGGQKAIGALGVAGTAGGALAGHSVGKTTGMEQGATAGYDAGIQDGAQAGSVDPGLMARLMEVFTGRPGAAVSPQDNEMKARRQAALQKILSGQ